MGKPSSLQLAKSSQSLQCNNSKTKMNSQMKTKKSQIIKERRNKNKKIKKLFENLRNESRSEDSINSSRENTVILNENGSKRKLSISDELDAKRVRTDNSVIIINDDSILNEDCCIVTPKKPCDNFFSSTPNSRSGNVHKFSTGNNNDLCVNNLNDTLNLTKQINDESYLTIDLTGSNSFNTARNSANTVQSIDLVNVTDSPDCKLVSVKSNDSSLSNESNVTVLRKSSKQLRTFKQGIAKMNSSERGKLLECIMQNIFSGCNVTIKKNLTNIKNVADCGIETRVESERDLYIKEVIVGDVNKRSSRNSVGSNIYHPDRHCPKTGLRMIVIDGSNVAMEHSKGKVFSVKGLQICINYFVQRGHVVKAFVPRFRCKFGKSSNPRLLDQLERQGLVIYTPSREIQGRFIASYDDRYIVQTAAEFDGVIVSGDNYRDLINENAKWRYVIENRLLPFTWVDDMIIFPKDPLGRHGPSLNYFLSHNNGPATTSNNS